MSTKEQITAAINLCYDAFNESIIKGTIIIGWLPYEQILNMAMQQLKQTHDIEIEKLRHSLRNEKGATEKQKKFILSLVRGERGKPLPEDDMKWVLNWLKERNCATIEDLIHRITFDEATDILDKLTKKG